MTRLPATWKTSKAWSSTMTPSCSAPAYPGSSPPRSSARRDAGVSSSSTNTPMSAGTTSIGRVAATPSTSAASSSRTTSPLLAHFPELLPRYVPIDPSWARLNPQRKVTAYPISPRDDVLAAGLWVLICIAASVIYARLFQRQMRNARDFARYWIGGYLLHRTGLESDMKRFYGVPAEQIDIELARKRMLWISENASLRAFVARLRKPKGGAPTNRQLARPERRLLDALRRGGRPPQCEWRHIPPVDPTRGDRAFGTGVPRQVRGRHDQRETRHLDNSAGPCGGAVRDQFRRGGTRDDHAGEPLFQLLRRKGLPGVHPLTISPMKAPGSA